MNSRVTDLTSALGILEEHVNNNFHMNNDGCYVCVLNTEDYRDLFVAATALIKTMETLSGVHKPRRA